MFRCTTTAEAQFHTTAHHPAFQYEFNRPVPGQPLSIHGSDLTFVLGMYPRDWLPAELHRKRAVEGVLRSVFERWAYDEVQTPNFERFDALDVLRTIAEGDVIIHD